MRIEEERAVLRFPEGKRGKLISKHQQQLRKRNFTSDVHPEHVQHGAEVNKCHKASANYLITMYYTFFSKLEYL